MPEGPHGLEGLLSSLRPRWKLGLAAATAFLLAATVTVLRLPSQYDGSAIVSIAPRAGVPNAGADTVRVVGPRYIAFIASPQVASTVARKTGITRGEVQNALDVRIQPDTGNITVTARLASPALASRVANLAAAQAEQFSKRDKLLTASVVAAAVPNPIPAAPPKKLMIAASLIVAILIGVSVAVLAERIKPRIRTWRDIVISTNLPVIGRLPTLAKLQSEPLKAFDDPTVGSAFRTLRVNLELLLREGDYQTVLITSVHTGEGKTSISALAAEAFGRRGSSILLIDGDLRRAGLSLLTATPRSSWRYPRTGGPRGGLADLVTGQSDIESEIMPGWTLGFSVLPTKKSTKASDGLAKRFGDLVKTLRPKYDFIIIDGPPVLGSDDSHTIAAVADAVVLVVAAGSTEDSVNEAILELRAAGANILGIIGNRLGDPLSYYADEGEERLAAVERG